jgi:hypothetical protein
MNADEVASGNERWPMFRLPCLLNLPSSNLIHVHLRNLDPQSINPPKSASSAIPYVCLQFEDLEMLDT